MNNVEQALAYIADGMTVGLGSGHASERFIHTLAERVRAGLGIRGVPTSRSTARLAVQLGIPLVALEESMPLDITVDGADEVDPKLNLIKGYGHALVREKIVAAASRKLVILIGPEHLDEKIVSVLGQRGQLPIEVIPFALPLCRARLAEIGYTAEPLRQGESLFFSDNGNAILHCQVTAIDNPAELDRRILAIPGVVGTGLFVDMADVVLIQHADRLEVRTRDSRR